MTSRNTKTILLASLIAAAVAFSTTDSVHAEKTQVIQDRDKYDYLAEIVDRKNFKKAFVSDGVAYAQNFKTEKIGDGVYDVQNVLVIDSNRGNSKIVLNYQIAETNTGYDVTVPDQPKLKIMKPGLGVSDVSMSVVPTITPTGHVEGSYPATIVTEDSDTINNGFASGSDRYTQTCFTKTSTWSMSWQADTTWQGSFSNDWSNVNWTVSGEQAYLEWCIFPFYTHSTKVTVSGTDYSHTKTFYGFHAIGPYGWSGAEIENPWDDIDIKVEFKQKSFP